MNPIVRNLMSVVRRFKLAATLNILGLSVAFAAFIIIMIQLNYDYRFDKFHKDSDKIFRVELTWGTSWQAIFPRPLAESFFESSPHIVAGALTRSQEFKSFFYIEKEGERNFFEENSLGVTPDFFDVFTFDFVEGTEEALKTPQNTIIPLSLSRKLFGNESAVGQQLIYSWGNQTVGAVYRDLPSNSIFNNCMFLSLSENENKGSWGNSNYITYIRVNQKPNAHLLIDNFKRTFDTQAVWGESFDWENSGNDLRLTALPDIHYVTGVQWDTTPKSNRQTLSILFAIAIVIVVIAGINFTNFSTALTPVRVKSINTQRVLGARQNTLRFSLVFEAVFVSFLSYLVALLLVSLFHESPLAKLVDADLSLTAQPLIVGGTALIALFTGLFAGLYPSRYMTSFAPALVLKGSFGLSPKGEKMRNTLIGIQYVASFALIIGASFMFLQNFFMRNSPLGYDRDELIVTNISRIQGNRDAFTNQLKSYSGIEDVTYGETLLSTSDKYMEWGRRYKGEMIHFQCFPVHHTFLKVMGIELAEGRDFRQEDANTERGVLVFNETAQKRYNLELNTMIVDYQSDVNNGEIVGFMPDVKFASFRTAVEPMAFYVWGIQNLGTRPSHAYIKVKAGANMRAVMSHIHATLSEFDAAYTFEVRFFDEVLQRLYEKETSLSSLISLFSLIAIFISIVGVFGLVVFDSECRRKEIGIRKVLGASTMSIIIMFNKAYFKILVICFVVAAPLAWYAVTRWLENFAYKTPMYWWVYLLAFVAVGIITVATVTFQNWRVASDDPVKAIKSE
ncbi:MAG: ABC transporter permease [Tannerella sp.]|jgi:putative ABC transport system permease protein|nr:ABC transporter permease [Tannerella sp.]